MYPDHGLTVTGEIWVVKGIFPGFRGKFAVKTGNFGLFFPNYERLRGILPEFGPVFMGRRP
jgi:hypothetical protein